MSVQTNRITFWPRFSISRIDLGNQVKVKDMFTLRRLLAQNFDAVLNMIVKLAGDAVFAKSCQDT